MQLNDLRVNLTLDNNGFRLSVADSTRILRQFEQRLGGTADAARRTEGALESFGTRAHRMIQTVGLARFALMDLNDILLAFPKALLTSAGEIERMTKLMEGLSTQASETARKIEAASNVKFVFNLAQNAPFEIKALTDTMVKFKTAGIDPTNGSMQALVDSVSKFGGSSEQLHRASIAIQQMAGKGVVSMEELRQQLGEAVPTAMNAMAVGMKMSMADLTQAVSKGTVASGTALKKMLAVMTVDNAGAAAEMMTTWSGMLERLKSKWEIWKVSVAGEGMAEGAKAALKDLIDAFGSPSAASFGRRVGEAMSSATMAVINFTKTVAGMWEEIKTAGELILLYFGASKVAPVLMATAEKFKSYYTSITAGMATVRANAIEEARMRTAQLMDQARLVEQTIAGNNAVIASEQSRVAAGRAARAAELADTIAANRAILGVYAQRQTANAAAIAAASPANSPAVRAVQRGVATAAQDLEAQVLLRHADAARLDSAEIARRTAALQAQNVAMATERTMLTTTAGAMTSESAARLASNNHLQQSADRFRRLAGEVTVTNTAMNAMRAAGATVVSALSSMLFSMNGLILVVMAAAWAWSHFSDKAKQAAKDAEIAFETKKRLEEGKYNEDTLKSSEQNIKNKEEQIARLKEQLDSMRNSRGGAGIASPRKKQIEEEIKALQDALPVYRANLDKERIAVARRTGEDEGRALVDEYTYQVNAQLDRAKGSVEKINQKYADITVKQGKLTPEQKKERETELFDARTVELSNAVNMWDAKAKELQVKLDAQKAILTQTGLSTEKLRDAEKEAYRLQAGVNGALKQRSNLSESLNSLNAPNEILDPKKKEKKQSVMDSVLAAINSERTKVSKAETGMNGLLEDVLDVARLKEDFRKEIDALNENDKDKHVTKKHDADDERELIELKTQKAVIDRLKSLYGGLAKQRRDIEEEYRLSVERMSTGNFQLQGKGPAQRVVDQLEAELKIAEQRAEKIPGEAERIRKALDDARAILTNEQGVEGAKMFGDNKSTLDSLAVSNQTNERRRMQMQQALELDMIRQKHAAQIRAVKDNQDLIDRLTIQHNAEDLAIATKHANEMRTPLDKLAEGWADVTSNMQGATERWASSTMDAFVNTVTGGKFQFRDLAASILKDMARIQLQETFGGVVKNGMKSAGDFLMGAMNVGNSGGEKSGGSAGGGETMKALSAAFNKLIGGSESAANSIGNTLANSAGDAAAKMGESVIAAGVQMTAEETAANAMIQLTTSAMLASEALIQAAAAAAASSAGDMAGSFFANGGIMSSAGSLPLNMYSNGGIADRPQLAVFGEGSMNEAYVPLPDGRSIPVTMKGGGGAGGQTINISIAVSNDGKEDKQSSGQDANTWSKMADRVKDVVRQELVGQQRPGGLLYK